MTSYSLRACVFVCVKSEVEAEDSMYKEIRLQTDCTQNPVLRNWTVKKKRKEKEKKLDCRRRGKSLNGLT